MAKISGADQTQLSTLPGWQRIRLQELGIESGSEVSLGRKPVASTQLIAAIRILAASDESQLQGRSAVDLGALEKPLHGEVEVSLQCWLAAYRQGDVDGLERLGMTKERGHASLLAPQCSLKHCSWHALHLSCWSESTAPA